MSKVLKPNNIFYLMLMMGMFYIIALWLHYTSYKKPPMEQSTGQASDEIDTEDATFIYPKSWRFYKNKISRPWYMTGGSGGTSSKRTGLFPHENPFSDRIEEQLLYAPETNNKTKLILVYNGFRTWSRIKAGSSAFSSCPVKHCILTDNKDEAVMADAIVFNEYFIKPEIYRSRRQVWIFFMVESPYHAQHIKEKDVFNWTASYRWDADIVVPYDKWVKYDKEETFRSVRRNFALNKTKKVAWFVSNCSAKNNRIKYAQELRKHIEVDIYGSCGEKKCPRTKRKECYNIINADYKFYLSFENSNCQDYITEKFFKNGLRNDVIPIVMGAKPEEYARSAPLGSYIHVDDFESPKALADYLHILDKNDDLYNSYFRWREVGEFIDTRFFCRMCALLHGDFPEKSYHDVNTWLGGPGICNTSWAIHKSFIP